MERVSGQIGWSLSRSECCLMPSSAKEISDSCRPIFFLHFKRVNRPLIALGKAHSITLLFFFSQTEDLYLQLGCHGNISHLYHTESYEVILCNSLIRKKIAHHVMKRRKISFQQQTVISLTRCAT